MILIRDDYHVVFNLRLPTAISYILVENVKGFEDSSTRDVFIETLKSCGYVYQEFLLTPLQFGIPNSRLRYYCIAKHKSNGSNFSFTPCPEVLLVCCCCMESMSVILCITIINISIRDMCRCVLCISVNKYINLM